MRILIALVSVSLIKCGNYYNPTKQVVAHGDPLLTFAYIDPDMKKDIYWLAGATAEIVGYDLFAFNHYAEHAYNVSFNTKEVKIRAEQGQSSVIGYCNYVRQHVYIAVPGETFSYHNNYYNQDIDITLTQERYRSILTHELGHAMGLEHVKGDPLMNPAIYDYCNGKEAECLVNALIDQEKI